MLALVPFHLQHNVVVFQVQVPVYLKYTQTCHLRGRVCAWPPPQLFALPNLRNSKHQHTSCPHTQPQPLPLRLHLASMCQGTRALHARPLFHTAGSVSACPARSLVPHGMPHLCRVPCAARALRLLRAGPSLPAWQRGARELQLAGAVRRQDACAEELRRQVLHGYTVWPQPGRALLPSAPAVLAHGLRWGVASGVMEGTIL